MPLDLKNELFNRRVFTNALVFSAPVSMLILWRLIYSFHIAFFSADALEVFLSLTAICLVLYLSVFFMLYWLSQRKQEYDDR